MYFVQKNSTFGIQVTRGIEVDAESARSKGSEPDTVLTDVSPEQPNLGRGFQVTIRFRKVNQAVDPLQIPIKYQQRRLVGLDGPNDMK